MRKFRPVWVTGRTGILTSPSVLVTAFPCASTIFFIAKIRRSYRIVRQGSSTSATDCQLICILAAVVTGIHICRSFLTFWLKHNKIIGITIESKFAFSYMICIQIKKCLLKTSGICQIGSMDKYIFVIFMKSLNL